MLFLDRFCTMCGRKAVLWLLPLGLIYGVLSALRWPQTYALSHMVIDYHFGFGKRGLIGTILSAIDHPPYHYITLAWMAFAVFTMWLALLTAATWRDLTHDSAIPVAVLVFFLSAGFASLVCDVGRGEHFGLVAALLCLLMPVRPLWLLPRTSLLVVAVLMQEANFLIVVPVVAFDIWIGHRPTSTTRSAVYAAGTVLPATLLTWRLGSLRTACDTVGATAYFQHLVVDFPVQAVPVATLCLDGPSNMGLAWHALWSVDTNAALLPLAFSVALPSTLFNLLLAKRIMRHRALAVAVSFPIAMMPVALLTVAVDVVRFTTLTQVTSLLVLISATRRLERPSNGVPSQKFEYKALAITLIAFELGTGITLTDGSQMLKFPFAPLVVRAISVVHGRAPFVVIE